MANTEPDDIEYHYVAESTRVVSIHEHGSRGWAYFEHNRDYSPLVGAFLDSVLVGVDVADRDRPEGATSGPERHWFDMSWRGRLKLSRAELGRLRFFRCEDYSSISSPATDSLELSKVSTIEEMLATSIAPMEVGQPLRFSNEVLSIPAAIDMLYLDYIDRAADWPGFDNYIKQIRDHGASFDEIRRHLLGSDEFNKRFIRLSDRLGRLSVFPFEQVYVQYALAPKLLESSIDLSWSEFTSGDLDNFLELAYRRILGMAVLPHEAEAYRNAVLHGDTTRLTILEELLGRSAVVKRTVRLLDVPSRTNESLLQFNDFLLSNLQDLCDHHFVCSAYQSLWRTVPVDWLKKRLEEELETGRADRRGVLELAGALPPQLFVKQIS